VKLEAVLGSSLPVIAADRVSIQQVLLNLALNGMDAMEDVESPAERKLTVGARALDEGVELTITDTGHGIPRDRLSKVFDAFFTTKKEGVGLGLAISRSIVEAHGGRIAAEDHDGHGATFRVVLPVGHA
jgi:signal transduction histidine kinase